MRMLKCPKCKRQSAYKVYRTQLYPDGTHRHYTQKICHDCGYTCPKNYRGRVRTTEDECISCRIRKARETEREVSK